MDTLSGGEKSGKMPYGMAVLAFDAVTEEMLQVRILRQARREIITIEADGALRDQSLRLVHGISAGEPDVPDGTSLMSSLYGRVR